MSRVSLGGPEPSAGAAVTGHASTNLKRSSDGGTLATSSTTAAAQLASRRAGERSKSAHVRTVPLEDPVNVPRPQPVDARGRSKSHHVRSIPIDLFEEEQDGEGYAAPPKRISNRLKALRSLSPKAPTTKSKSNRSLSPMPILSTNSNSKKTKVSHAQSHSESRSRSTSANTKRRDDLLHENSSKDAMTTTAGPRNETTSRSASLSPKADRGVRGMIKTNSQRFVHRVKRMGSSEGDGQSGGSGRPSRSLSPKPRMIIKTKSERFVQGVASTVRGGAGLVANTAIGGAELAAKGAMGGAGLALKGARGGAGLAVKGVSTGVGVVANTAKGGAGLAVHGLEGGLSRIKSAKSSLLGEHTGGDIDGNVMAIYSSELYSIDFVTKEIQSAIDQPEIDTLFVEDLVLRGHDTLDEAAINLVRKTALIPNDQKPLHRSGSSSSSSCSSHPDHLEISVCLFAGEDLAACDSDILGRETTSDPYVMISIIPSKGPEIELGRTKHCIKTLNPRWNFQLSKVIAPESFPSSSSSLNNDSNAASSFTLQFKLMDFDLVGDDDCMGIVQIPLEVSSRSTKVCREPSKWWVVPHDSAPKASGRIKVKAEWNMCYGEVMPMTINERHWKQVTFIDNITCLEDYNRHTNNKRQFQTKVQKILRQKGINKFPIKFETKVEILNLGVYETISLLNLIAEDETILKFHLPNPDSDYYAAQSTAAQILSGKDLKKLPKTLASKFNKDTLEWKDDAEPLLIHIKYGNKPKDKKRIMKHAILFRQCALRIEQVAKKSSNWDEDELQSSPFGGCDDHDRGDLGALGAESTSSLPFIVPNKSDMNYAIKKKLDEDVSESSFDWDDYVGESGAFASERTSSVPCNLPHQVPNQSYNSDEKKENQNFDDSASSFCWDDYDGGYSGIFAMDTTSNLLEDAADESSPVPDKSESPGSKDGLKGAAIAKRTEKWKAQKVVDDSDAEVDSRPPSSCKSKEKEKSSSNAKSDALPWDAETAARISKLQEQKKHLKDVIDYAKSLAPFSEEAKQQLAKRAPELFNLDRQIDELMGLGTSKTSSCQAA